MPQSLFEPVWSPGGKSFSVDIFRRRSGRPCRRERARAAIPICASGNAASEGSDVLTGTHPRRVLATCQSESGSCSPSPDRTEIDWEVSHVPGSCHQNLTRDDGSRAGFTRCAGAILRTCGESRLQWIQCDPKATENVFAL